MAALAVALLPLVYFFPATRGALYLAPDDGIIFNVPLRVAAARIMLGGSLPLWNPYLFGGMPLHGAAQAGVLFPLNWFYLACTPALATNLMMLTSYALAALGAYFYARRSGSGIAGAAVTSLVWQWSAFLVEQIGHTNILQTAAMLPWVLWAIDRYAMRDRDSGNGSNSANNNISRTRRGALLALLVALQTFAGHQQTLLYSLLVAGAYALVMSGSSKETRAAYLRSLIFIAAGVSLAAVQILPTFELLRNSLRAEASYDFFSSFSMPPRFALTLFAPYLLGGADGSLGGLFRAPYIGPSFFGEYVAYVGALTLMLALVAVTMKPDARTKFWAAIVVICLPLAFGRFLPLDAYQLIYYVPVLNLFRVPARHLMEVEFALAVLAGRGLTSINARRGEMGTLWRASVAGVFVFVLTCLAVACWRPADFQLGRHAPVSLLRAPELFVPVVFAGLSAWALWRFARAGSRRRNATAWWLLLLILALDLFVWGQAGGWRTHSPTRESELWREPAAVKFLRAREAQNGAVADRVLTAQHSFNPDLPVPAPTPTENWTLALQPDIYMMHSIENAAGYDGFGLSRYSRLAGDMKVWGDLTDPERTLRGEGRELDLLNVRYLLAASSSPSATSSTRASSSNVSSLYATPAESYGGVRFAAEDLNVPALETGARLSFNAPPVEVDRVALLTNLSWSVDVPDGATVGHVRLRSTDGQMFDFYLRAGADTSDWAYDRADIRTKIRHKRAPVATSYTVEDAQGKYEAHTYLATFALPSRAMIEGGDIFVEKIARAPDLSLSVRRVSLVDESDENAYPLRREWVRKVVSEISAADGATASTHGEMASVPRWRKLAQLDDVAVFENTRVLPRAWLASAELVAGEEQELDIIRSGKLANGQVWNPLQTALVESPSNFSDGGVETKTTATAMMTETGAAAATQQGSAEVTRYEPNQVEVRTESRARAILVLSENHYPGWRAEVDGRAVETLRVDYNLRGVVLTPGAHVVEFVYRPKSALLGLIISLLTAAMLLLLSFTKPLARRRGRSIVETSSTGAYE